MNRFDLDTAVSAWRRTLEHRHGFTADDLEELECHVRDYVDARSAGGVPVEEAFREAVRRFGDTGTVEAEYRKTYRARLVHRRILFRTLIQEGSMLVNYVKIALRTFLRRPGLAALNVAGLAVGMATCLLILLYVQDELRYDRHHEKADRVFRLTASYTETGRHWAPIGPPVGAAVRAAIPEVEAVARFFPLGSGALFEHDGRTFEAPGGTYADSTVFDVFTLPLLQGDPGEALVAPGSVVLSATTARRLFGANDPMGRSLLLNGQRPLTVTGVMEDVPAATHLPFDYLVSLTTFYAAEEENWIDEQLTWSGFYTYLLLRTPGDADVVRQKLPAFVTSFFRDRFEGVRPEEELTFVLQPLPDIHLHSRLEKEYTANGDVRYVYVFSVVAAMVLLIACINFVNLATARATKRMREVGVRKSMGATRGVLVRQFMGESMLTVLLALVVAAGLMALFLPAFEHLTGKAFGVADLARPGLLAGLAGVLVFTGFVSGSYPAFVLSGFRPTEALRGVGGSGGRGGRLRRGLVVFQFAISIFLIASTLVVSSQLRYFRTTQLGFDKEQVVNLHLGGDLFPLFNGNLEGVKEELLRSPAIKSVSRAADYPGERYSLETVRVAGRQEADEGTQLRIAWGVDHDYARTLGLRLAAGRDFSKAAPADTNAWLVNEAAVRRLELGADPVGQVVRWNDYAGPIVGVVEDFHFASLHHEIEPLVIPLRPGVGGTVLVRVEAGRTEEALAFLEAQLDRMAPGALFRYTFLDDVFDRNYAAEDRLGDVFTAFALLAILIACLGLFGLAAFTAERRTKEIGIRKALGATAPGIAVLLSKDFAVLVGVAFVVAAPAAWFVLRGWLAGFAYRIDVSPAPLLLAGLAALAVALATIAYQSVKAARANPVKALRYE